ncbi:helix-turn-helix domain-containing protein [Halobaculum litoreum]|uniref:DUF7845 domain-containing protein n=1 Tax=Halobaculum litoreum TaxID=3031998 RepID=UPI0024C2B3E4|nr:helix-turn-helix domain-containing protein [Halobaculum sp. DT92]
MSFESESFAAAPGGDRDAGSLPVSSVEDVAPKPRAHGASVANVLNDLAPSDADAPAGQRDTLYADAVRYWRENVESHENEPYPATEFDAEWLPETAGEWVLLVKSSGWKAGTGYGDDYSQYYEQHIMLRERVETDDGVELRKPPLALHVEVMPQYRDLVFKSGDPLECPYGEGTRVVCWTTWAESGSEVERRMYDAIRAVYGDDVLGVARDRNPDSRRVQKAEAHYRFDRDKKGAVVETVEQSKDLVAWGGNSEIDAHQKRVQEGWLEARVESDRWDLLGFADVNFATEVKIYEIPNWHKRPASDPHAHPKIEASFAGADGKLPHVSEWDDAMDHLRTVVATHAHWAGVERADLVSDDFFDGAGAAEWTYHRPTGRREHLRQRYQEVATEVYREALKDSTVAVYDILRVIATETGATYDMLEDRTGLARSTIRYHVARLAREGVVKRLGNPVLVVFVSRDLLERSREILDRARPGRTADDMREDAEDRREDREARDTPSETDEDSDAATDDEAAPQRDEFVYLGDVPETIRDVAVAVYDGRLGDEDVRIRERRLREAPG